MGMAGGTQALELGSLLQPELSHVPGHFLPF